jgi:pyruvate/2-oxoglutarate dehydrogenase complex dihydrolipoamide dehydrogenase (E3) component
MRRLAAIDQPRPCRDRRYRKRQQPLFGDSASLDYLLIARRPATSLRRSRADERNKGTMSTTIEADLCIIGAGSAGLSVAAGASQMGARTVLIEAGRMGGDCLNYGCVPSKSLLAAAHLAYAIRRGGAFGVDGHEPVIDFERVHDHVHEVIAGIEPHDSQARFEGLGVTVLRDHASFCARDQVQVGEARVRARRFVIATGSRPSVPPIPGLADVPYLTNETVFNSRTAPGHLLIVGGGPIGCELAQAHRRLGAEVTVVDIGPVLPKDDPELTRIVRERLVAEGVAIHDRVRVEAVAGAGNGVVLTIEEGGQTRRIEGSHLLVAAGRTPRVDGLGLEIAGVAYGKGGVEVDQRLRTSNKRIYAIGDVVGGPQFTHVGSYHAGIVIRNALFRLPARIDYRALPWVTYTDPELAHVGRTEASARDNGEAIEVLRWNFEDNDRARTERRTEGFVKVVTGRRGRILGASIVGAHAGELILPWVLAIRQKLGIGAMAEVIAPYPTLGEVSKRAAGSYYAPKLFGPTTRWLVRQLARLG